MTAALRINEWQALVDLGEDDLCVELFIFVFDFFDFVLVFATDLHYLFYAPRNTDNANGDGGNYGVGLSKSVKYKI